MAKIVNNQVIIASIGIFLLLIAAFLSNLLLAHSAIHSADHNWCVALKILTQHPIPKPHNPKSDPSRENAYLFYQSLAQLERKFGC